MSQPHSRTLWQLTLPPPLKLILLALADESDAAGQCCMPPSGISRKTGYSQSLITKWINEAMSRSLLEGVQLAGGETPPGFRLQLPLGAQGGAA